jgi:heterodisulfide reductase subunit A
MFPSVMQALEQDHRGVSTRWGLRVEEAKPPRIGVFVCHCGHNIAGYLDVPALVEAARALPGVEYAMDSLFICSDAGLAAIRAAIVEHSLNRVVVASCTPRTHEHLFQATCEEAGLNRYLFEFVNVRDQCSWVHMGYGPRATEKAQDLIRMGVAKAALLVPLDEAHLPVHPAAVVIGGGMAGMTAALSLARRGFAVTLVEREPELGGILRHLDRLYPTRSSARELVERLGAEVRAHPHIEVLTAAEVNAVRGHIGNFELEVRCQALGLDPLDTGRTEQSLTVQAGVIIVATGAEELKPTGLYGYGSDPKVITQQELEDLLANNSLRSHSSIGRAPISSVVMLQCVGARDEIRAYCGRTCCLTAIKNAMEIKERLPGAEVYVLYRDIEVHGTHFEDYYGRARDHGIIFTRYTPANPPQVEEGRVIVYDELLGGWLGIPYDLLVLSTPLVPRPGARGLAQMLKVPIDEYGFFLEAHVKLRPLDFATDGVYLCGSAHWPAHLDEAISQAFGAAARAGTILSKEQIRASGAVAQVDEFLCRGCERCAGVCEFAAIEFMDLAAGGACGFPSGQVSTRKVARVNPVLCKGCGSCAVVCPTCAMQAAHFTSAQVTAMIQAAMGG